MLVMDMVVKDLLLLFSNGITLQYGSNSGSDSCYFPLAFNWVLGIWTQVTSWTSAAPNANFINITQYVSGSGFMCLQSNPNFFNWIALGAI